MKLPIDRSHDRAQLLVVMQRQDADAVLNSGLTDDGWLNHLIAQQRPWLNEIKNVGHHPRLDLIPLVDQINGYTFIRNNRDGRTALFLLDEFERRQW